MRDSALTYEALVLDYIRGMQDYGATADECLHNLGLSHQNGSARVSTLAKKQLIIRTNRKRMTRSGRRAYVYVAAVFAREEP
jgi:predicted transcriptional regulator